MQGPAIRRTEHVELAPHEPRATAPLWYALYTRARHEKQVDARLRQKSFEVFLPLIPRVSRWHDRTKVVRWPLFPGYVFTRFSREQASQVLRTPGVVAVVRNNGAPAPISDQEIVNVRRFAAAVAASGVIPKPAPWVEKGQRVQIVRGPLDKVEGAVIEKRGGDRVVVQVGVRAIGHGLKVEVPVESVRVIEKR